MKKIALAVPILVVIAGVFAWKKASAGPTVTAVIVERGAAVEAVYATGRVEPRDRVVVKSATQGRIAELRVHEGDRVAENDVLARIEDPTMAITMRQREADLRAARIRASSSPQNAALRAQEQVLNASLQQAEAELARVQGLVQSGTTPASELDRVQLRITDLHGQIDANRSQQRDVSMLSRAELSREELSVAFEQARAGESTVRAPIDGTVLQMMVDPGEIVAVDQPIARVADLRILQLEAYVDETDVARIATGVPAVVRMPAMPNEVVHGHVHSIAPDADRDRNSYRVVVTIDGDTSRLRVGMTAEINLVLQEHANVPTIPSDAVHDGSVWILDRNGQVHRRHIVTGIQAIGRTEVVQGLAPGDRVVIGAVDHLREGQVARAQIAGARGT